MRLHWLLLPGKSLHTACPSLFRITHNSSLLFHLTCYQHTAVDGSGSTWGVNGTTGESADMNKLAIWEPYCVKTQTLKTAIERYVIVLYSPLLLQYLPSPLSSPISITHTHPNLIFSIPQRLPHSAYRRCGIWH